MAIDLDNLFVYHPPTGDQVERYQILRDAAKEVAKVFLSNAGFEEKTEAYLSYRKVLETNAPNCHQRDVAEEAINNAFKLATDEHDQRLVDLVLTASMFANASLALN
jgi:hypothetical protein